MSIYSQRTDRSTQLIRLNDARRALADARTLEQIKVVRERAESVRAQAHLANLGLELQNYASELKLQAERVGGQMLTDLRLRGGSGRNGLRRSRCLRLRELGIDKNQSARWQLVATVPESLFRQYVCEVHDSGREISEAGLIRLAKRLRKTSIDRMVVRSLDERSRVSTTSHLLTMNWTSLENVGSDIDSLSEMLTEICNHYELVIELVQDICQEPDGEQESVRCRALNHYLAEIHALLFSVNRELERLSQHPELNGFHRESVPESSGSEIFIGCTETGRRESLGSH